MDKETNDNTVVKCKNTMENVIKYIIKRIIKIDKIITEKQKKSHIDLYNNNGKIHKKQLEFHKCQKRNRWVFGGNRSGKTECGAVETVWIARGIHPFRKNKKNVIGWVVSLSQQVQRDVAQTKILYYLKKEWIKDISMLSGRADNPSGGVIDYIDVYNVFGGISRIGFKSCEAQREKFQGTSLDFVWFDEEPPLDIYTECLLRVLDKCGDIYGTMTPLLGQTYIYDKIYLNENDDPDVWYIVMEWADNPYLDKAEIEKYSKILNKDELDSRRYGKFKSLCGLVYNEFDVNKHVIEPFDVPHEWYNAISIDPGLNNPLSCHWYAIDPENKIYVIKEHYEKLKDINYHVQKIKKISNELGFIIDHKKQIFIDSAANQHTLTCNKSLCELFWEQGLLVNPNVNKDLFTGINRVKHYLKNENGEAKLFIFSTCENLIREFKNYKWGKDDSPIKKDDHALDELRYFICSRQKNNFKSINVKSELEEEKERLIRKNRHR